MHTLGTSELLHRSVLRKQCDGLRRTSAEHRLKIVHQREPGTLDLCRCCLGTGQGFLNEPLDGRLHATQNLCWRLQTHQFHGAYRLVQVLTRHPQGRGVHRIQLVVACMVRLAYKPVHRFVGNVQ